MTGKELLEQYQQGKRNFAGADLQNADLWGANLQHANLRGADLQNADLWGANLLGADLQNASGV
jgi:uncharacterized protein YjbI with pentapeptide repeats